MSNRLFNDSMLAHISRAYTTGLAQFLPEVNKLVASEFVEYRKESFLKLRFPIKNAYKNPFHMSFGELYDVFFDMTFRSFSGLESGGITSSLNMNITLLKPLSVSDKFVEVTAEIVSSTKSFFIVVATSTRRMILFDPIRIRKSEK